MLKGVSYALRVAKRRAQLAMVIRSDFLLGEFAFDTPEHISRLLQLAKYLRP